MKKEINYLEDIYPLTIVTMRYGGKYIIFNMESDSELIHDIQLGESAMYDTEKYIEEKYSGLFGIGNTICNAFVDFQKRAGKENEVGYVYINPAINKISYKTVE